MSFVYFATSSVNFLTLTNANVLTLTDTKASKDAVSNIELYARVGPVPCATVHLAFASGVENWKANDMAVFSMDGSFPLQL